MKKSKRNKTAKGPTIRVVRENGKRSAWPKDTPARKIFGAPTNEDGLHYLGAMVNNDTCSLSYPLEIDSTVSPLTLADRHGYRIYRRSLAFLLAKAVKELYPLAHFAVEHSLGSGLYCSFEDNGSKHITRNQVKSLEKRMRELVEKNLPIQRIKISFESAMEQFKAEGQEDKYNLLRFQNPPKIVISSCDGFSDLAKGCLADTTGALQRFKLIHYAPGLVLQFPTSDNPTKIRPFSRNNHLFDVFQEHKAWGRILGVQTVGQLNQAIVEKKIDDIIKITEAFHEKKIASIADAIHAQRDRIRWVLIAGPSSAGKTTFTKRLSVQLRVTGMRPVLISGDDYFVDRDKTPRDPEDGEYDFEHIETIDLDLLNEHMRLLEAGEEIELPRFDFERGQRVLSGKALRLERDQIVLIEGIHCLNPTLTRQIDDEHKYRIFVSALTQLNLDFNTRLSTTDNRLLRRMVRDNQFRGNSALDTLRMWPKVRRGEHRWIFPFQKHADIAFNSALDYEWAVLRPLAEPLLAEIKPRHVEYAETRRVMEFLQMFLDIPYEAVPENSLLREFVGKSSFKY